MNLIIRQEKNEDHNAVFSIIEAAFRSEEYSDHREQFLVERLRTSDAFIPALSLVAEFRNKLVGHILLTRLEIKNQDQVYPSLALAPVSVLPEFQRKGIGGKLIEEAHLIAKSLGYESIVLIGHDTYYPRFGYKVASSYGIKFPFDVPAENGMAIELTDNALDIVSGMVVYPPEFFEK